MLNIVRERLKVCTSYRKSQSWLLLKISTSGNRSPHSHMAAVPQGPHHWPGCTQANTGLPPSGQVLAAARPAPCPTALARCLCPAAGGLEKQFSKAERIAHAPPWWLWAEVRPWRHNAGHRGRQSTWLPCSPFGVACGQLRRPPPGLSGAAGVWALAPAGWHLREGTLHPWDALGCWEQRGTDRHQPQDPGLGHPA